MKDLQKICNEVTEQLNKLKFLGRVGSKAGRLQDEVYKIDVYKAVFIFRREEEGRLFELTDFLSKELYNSKFISEKYHGFWRIVLLSESGKPAEQEKNLIRDLNSLKDYLRKYKATGGKKAA